MSKSLALTQKNEFENRSLITLFKCMYMYMKRDVPIDQRLIRPLVRTKYRTAIGIQVSQRIYIYK